MLRLLKICSSFKLLKKWVELRKDIERWMEKKGYESIEDFRGRLSLTKAANPGVYARAQYLGSFGGYAAAHRK